MKKIVFASLKDLYERLTPALITKTTEMNRVGYKYIKPEDIWNYLKETKWKSSFNLELHQMVNDILNSDNVLIDNYLKEKLNEKNRKIYFNENYLETEEKK